MGRIKKFTKLLLICLTLCLSSQAMAQSCYATGPSMSFPGAGGVTKYTTLQGGCSDGSSLQIQVGSKPSWISAYPTGNYSIAATASFNDSGGPRNGTITLTQFGTPIGVVSVSQEAGFVTVGQVSITAGPTQRCRGGGTSDYNASATNATSYSWAITNAGGSTINSSGIVNWASNFWGTATVTVTANGPNNSSSTASRSVMVKTVDTPTLVPSKTELCGSGDSATLTLAPLGANTRYALLNGNGSELAHISTGQNGPFVATWTVSSGDTYRVRGRLLDGSDCVLEWGNVTITQLQDLGNPVLSNPGTRCKGTGTSALSVSNGSSGNSYQWTLSNAGNSTINGSGSSATISWHAAFSGTATVTVAATSQCGTSTTLVRTINVTEPITWHQDTDGDGYPDPEVPTQERCTAPTVGNWTSNPRPLSDYCPNYFNNADGSNGCNPDCLEGVTVSNQVIDFSNQGGEETVTYNFPSCSTGYNIDIPEHPYDWLEVVPTGPNTFNLICDAGTEPKDHLIQVTVNGNSFYGNTGFSIRVRRGSSVDPDPDPDPCVANSMDNISFGAFSDSQDVTVSYSGDCIGTLVLRHPYDPNGVPGWLTVTPSSGSTFTLSVSENSSGETQSTILSPMMDDGNGNYTGMGVYFYVSQENCLTEWFIDTDGDTLGDVHGEPYTGCDAPDNTGHSWVSNNDDLCPEVAGSSANQGCPTGAVPENYNTVTSTGFDVNGTMKSSAKAYFDELGKPIQSQSWNIRTNDTWASETKYDAQGRPALQTLSAPIRTGNNFVFKDGFVQQSNNASTYSLIDFTGTKLENPNPVGISEGTLGWYYSDNNIRERYQDISSHPFVSTVYSTLNPGTVLRSLGGNKVDTNENGSIDIGDTWAQAYSFPMRASQELSVSVAFGTTEYNDDKIIKTIVRDVHGVENVVFSNSDGQVLASARSGPEGTASPSMSLTINEQGYVDVHVPEGLSGIAVSNGAAVTVYDLITEQTVSGLASLGNGFYRVAINDIENYDPIGSPITVTYNVNYYDYSLNEYDEAGRLTHSYQPLTDGNGNKLVTTFQYNTLGQLIRTTSVDEGTSEFIYREDGQIRFSQNSGQANMNEVSFTDYDNLGRPVESGVLLAANFASLHGDSASGSNKKEQLLTYYDGIPTTTDLTGLLPSSYQSPRFLSGNVAMTSSGGGDYQTFYSYDVYGRVEWIAQYLDGLGVKTIDYEYEPITGLVKYVRYQKNDASDRFIHWYTYDEANQLSTVQTSVDGTNWELNAEYIYYETGELKRTELAGGVQGLDYVYSLDGKLKSLNHPSLNAVNDPCVDENGSPCGDAGDLFGMQLDYHVGDYQRTSNTNIAQTQFGTDQLNGNIKGIRWKSANPMASDASEYIYGYDRNNWLTAANFDPGNTDTGTVLLADDESTDTYIDGQTATLEASQSYTLKPDFYAQEGSMVTVRINPNGGGSSEGDYDVTNITYDPNGNIQSLVRNKGSQDGNNAMDNLSYTYRADRPNQLLRVNDSDGDVPNADDIGDQSGENYLYNNLGQLVQDTGEGVTYTYNSRGLVSEIQKNNVPLVTFFYNDRNQRSMKESYNSSGALLNTTYYVRDVAGSILAVYMKSSLGNAELVESPIYGNGRIGVAYGSASTRSYIYELTDHLGNVRAVFQKSGTNAVGEGYTDYYPGGMAMPNRNLEDANGYRYGYQGQFAEEDDETGLNAFELRLYDPRINRWLTVDPMGQFDSPYLAMGNNWISYVDSDGGECCNGWKKDAEGNNMLDGVTVTGSAQTSVNVLDIANFFGGLKNNFNQGLKDRAINTFDFIQNDLTSSDYWGPAIYNAGVDFANANIAATESGLDIYSYSTFLTANTISNMSANELAYTAGYNSPEIGLLFTPAPKFGLRPHPSLFSAKGGYGLFGKSGLNVGNYRIDALYRNPAAGPGAGTYLSVKQQVQGGNLFRLDYGKLHSTGQMSIHATYRLNTRFGRVGSSTTQFPIIRF